MEQTMKAGPIATAKRENAKDLLLWHGRWNVGAWFDHWPYDQRRPRAATEGAWVINGGYVVDPRYWLPLPEDPTT
jgi:hypothetical protein